MTGPDPDVVDRGSLNCREFVEIVTDYIEDDLPRAARADFDHHLDVCVGCTNYLDQMRATIALSRTAVVRGTDGDALTQSAREALFDAFRRSRNA